MPPLLSDLPKHGQNFWRTAAKRSASSVDDLLRAVAAELGLGRAVEILAGERARIRAVLRG
jgi:hypothetical protein